jgi:hypothetical protein
MSAWEGFRYGCGWGQGWGLRLLWCVLHVCFVPLPPPPTPGTGLYELWKAGLYRNYHPDRLVDLVAR